MRSARAILRRVIDLQALALGHVLLTVVLWRSRGRAVTVLDIDNTLADSWPTLTAPVASERADRVERPLHGRGVDRLPLRRERDREGVE